METKKHFIQNFEQLATSQLRRQALRIAEKGYEAIATGPAVRRQVAYSPQTQILKVQNKQFDLHKFERILCVGFGKAAFEAVSELQSILAEKISCGLVIDLKEGRLKNIICKVGTHPYPTKVNIEATKELTDMLSDCSEKDLVLCVVSGGGSALLCYPHDMSCETEVGIISALTVKGASIQELNTVRKHISKVKGGNLAKRMYPATVVSLIFSDVPGDDLSMIASGPTVLDTTTAREAAEILKKYDVLEACQLPSCDIIETPKEKKYFEKVHNMLLVSARQALMAMREEAEDLGFKTEYFSEAFQGEARVLAGDVVRRARKGVCLLGAGESTVRISGKGVGGRNQEMALSGLLSIVESSKQAGVIFGCFASDGHDNTEAAGAMVDESVYIRAKALGLNPESFLANNDSFTFFEATGDAVYTGLTGANVSDFFVCLKK